MSQAPGFAPNSPRGEEAPYFALPLPLNTQMTPTESRLNELLSLKDEALSQAHLKIEELEREMRFGVDWMMHERLQTEPEGLPVPRLELTLLKNWDFGSEQEVVLVLPERSGGRVRVPLAYSKTSGAGVPVESCPTQGVLPNHVLPSLINEACYYSETTGLPAYVVLDHEHRYKVEVLRPLRIIAA